jgi:hypothetical protein
MTMQSQFAPIAKASNGPKMGAFKDKDKPASVRSSNIVAAKSVADAVRTSLGPRGMDKMIQSANGEVTITNDGATILKQMSVIHPTAKMVKFYCFAALIVFFSWLSFLRHKILRLVMAQLQLSYWLERYWKQRITC